MQNPIPHKYAARSIVLGGIFLAFACQKPPTQELTDAENAVNAATQAGAEEYASAQIKSAQDALEDAKAKVAAKDYKSALAAAVDAKTKAENAKAVVEPNKLAKKAEVEEKSKSLRSRIDALKADAEKLKGKSLDAVKPLVGALTDQWLAVEEDINGEKFTAAETKIAEADAKAEELSAAIEEAKKIPAAAKSKGKKKK